MTERQGLHGCIPILCTPFLDDGSLDPASLEREIEFVIGVGAAGVAALAIASEGYKLTEAERDEVAHVVVATVAGRVPVVVSVDGAGTDVALDRVRRADWPRRRNHFRRAPAARPSRRSKAAAGSGAGRPRRCCCRREDL